MRDFVRVIRLKRPSRTYWMLVLIVVGLCACTNTARVDRRIRCTSLRPSERVQFGDPAWDQFRCEFVDYPGNWFVEGGTNAAGVLATPPHSYKTGRFKVWGAYGRVRAYELEAVDGHAVNLLSLGAGRNGLGESPFPNRILSE